MKTNNGGRFLFITWQGKVMSLQEMEAKFRELNHGLDLVNFALSRITLQDGHICEAFSVLEGLKHLVAKLASDVLTFAPDSGETDDAAINGFAGYMKSGEACGREG